MKLPTYFAVALLGAGATNAMALLVPHHGPAYHVGGIVGLILGAIILLLIERKSRASDGRAGSGSGRRDPDSDQQREQ